MRSVFLAYSNAAGAVEHVRLPRTATCAAYYLPDQVDGILSVSIFTNTSHPSTRIEIFPDHILLTSWKNDVEGVHVWSRDGRRVRLPVSILGDVKAFVLYDGQQFSTSAGRWTVTFPDEHDSACRSMGPPAGTIMDKIILDDRAITEIDSPVPLVETQKLNVVPDVLTHNMEGSLTHITREDETVDRSPQMGHLSMAQTNDRGSEMSRTTLNEPDATIQNCTSTSAIKSNDGGADMAIEKAQTELTLSLPSCNVLNEPSAFQSELIEDDDTSDFGDSSQTDVQSGGSETSSPSPPSPVQHDRPRKPPPSYAWFSPSDSLRDPQGRKRRSIFDRPAGEESQIIVIEESERPAKRAARATALRSNTRIVHDSSVNVPNLESGKELRALATAHTSGIRVGVPGDCARIERDRHSNGLKTPGESPLPKEAKISRISSADLRAHLRTTAAAPKENLTPARDDTFIPHLSLYTPDPLQASQLSTKYNPRRDLKVHRKFPSVPNPDWRQRTRNPRGLLASSELTLLGRPRVVFSSSCTVQSRKAVMASFKRLGGMTSSGVQNADVLIVPDGQLKKTAKFVLAVILGNMVVTEQWLIEAYMIGMFPDTNDYIPQDDVREKEWNFNLRDALARGRAPLSVTARLLDRYHVYISPQLQTTLGENYMDFTEIVFAMGALGVTAGIPNKESKVDTSIVLGEVGDAITNLTYKLGHHLYNRDLLVISALRGRIDLDSEEFTIEIAIKNEESD